MRLASGFCTKLYPSCAILYTVSSPSQVRSHLSNVALRRSVACLALASGELGLTFPSD